MSSHILVCDFNEQLLSCLDNHTLVVRVNEPGLIKQAVEAVREKNHISAIWLHKEAQLSDSSFKELENAGDVPIHLEAAGLGNFMECRDNIRLLRGLDVLVLLREDSPESHRDIRILSSLLLPSGIIFGDQSPDWESLADLMSYAVYGKVPHAPIQPFHFVISNYAPQSTIQFDAVYFDDPSKFLHIDARGRVALSRKELEEGVFVAEDLGQLCEIDTLPSYAQRLEAWREFFLKPEGCAYCPGWRICLGKFENSTEKETGCRHFFSELMEAAEFYQERKEKLESSRRPWAERQI